MGYHSDKHLPVYDHLSEKFLAAPARHDTGRHGPGARLAQPREPLCFVEPGVDRADHFLTRRDPVREHGGDHGIALKAVAIRCRACAAARRGSRRGRASAARRTSCAALSGRCRSGLPGYAVSTAAVSSKRSSTQKRTPALWTLELGSRGRAAPGASRTRGAALLASSRCRRRPPRRRGTGRRRLPTRCARRRCLSRCGLRLRGCSETRHVNSFISGGNSNSMQLLQPQRAQRRQQRRTGSRADTAHRSHRRRICRPRAASRPRRRPRNRPWLSSAPGPRDPP
jgi:hypothetical protein